jgi:hypothetical protein
MRCERPLAQGAYVSNLISAQDIAHLFSDVTIVGNHLWYVRERETQRNGLRAIGSNMVRPAFSEPTRYRTAVATVYGVLALVCVIYAALGTQSTTLFIFVTNAPPPQTFVPTPAPTCPPLAPLPPPIVAPETEVPTSATTPLVGFCFSGGVRSMAVVTDSLRRNVVNAIQPDASRRSIIFNLQTTNECDSNPVNVGTPGRVQMCEEMTAISSELVANGSIAALFGNATVNIDNNLDCNHTFAVNQSVCCQKRSTALNPPSGNGFWAYAQYLRRRLCIEHLRQAERERNVTFDYIVLMRPDLYFFEAVPPVTYLSRLRPHVLASSKEEGQPPGDYVYLMPRELMDAFDGALYDNYDGYCARDCFSDLASPPEFRLMTWVNWRHVPFQVYPFKFAIVRSYTNADCFRLSNEVLRVATERTPEGLRSLRHRCEKMFH